MSPRKPSTISPRMSSARGTASALQIHHPSDSPQVIDAKRNLKAIKLEEYVAKAMAEFPPLTDEQIDTVARLMLPSIVENAKRELPSIVENAKRDAR